MSLKQRGKEIKGKLRAVLNLETQEQCRVGVMLASMGYLRSEIYTR